MATQTQAVSPDTSSSQMGRPCGECGRRTARKCCVCGGCRCTKCLLKDDDGQMYCLECHTAVNG